MTLVWDFDYSDENMEEIIKFVEDPYYNFSLSKEPPLYVLKEYNGHNVKILVYKNTFMIQGKGIKNPNEYIFNLMNHIKKIKFLNLKEKSEENFQKFLPKIGIILCTKCGTSSNFVELEIENDGPIFKYNSCDCILNLRNYSFNLINNRLLPDLNVIISDSLIRLFNLGFFKDFTVIIPTYILDICDKKLLGKARQRKINEFIEKCVELKNKNFLKIINFKENEIIKFKEITENNFNQIEDKIFIELSKLTNSFLVTSDKSLKTQLLLQDLPLIYLDGAKLGKLKAFKKI